MVTASLSLEKVSILVPIIRLEGANRLFRSLIICGYGDCEISCEVDKERIGCPKMVKKLVDKASNDIVVFLGDDTVIKKGCIEEAYKVMQTFEGGYGLVGLNDMETEEPTHWMAHKKLLPEIGGEFFHTGYKHCFCDNELQYRAEELGRYKWAKEARLSHLHPMWDTAKDDDDYKRAYSSYEEDKQIFIKRNPKAKLDKRK